MSDEARPADKPADTKAQAAPARRCVHGAGTFIKRPRRSPHRRRVVDGAIKAFDADAARR